MYSEYEPAAEVRPQSRLVQYGRELSEHLMKLQALVRELQERLGPVLLPEPPSQSAGRDEATMKDMGTTAVADALHDATRMVMVITGEVQTLSRRIEV